MMKIFLHSHHFIIFKLSKLSKLSKFSTYIFNKRNSHTYIHTTFTFNNFPPKSHLEQWSKLFVRYHSIF